MIPVFGIDKGGLGNELEEPGAFAAVSDDLLTGIIGGTHSIKGVKAWKRNTATYLDDDNV